MRATTPKTPQPTPKPKKGTAAEGKQLVARTRNAGQWTEARFFSFIKGGLRQISMRWNPRAQALARARVSRGQYLCATCSKVGPATLPPPAGKAKRVKNAIVDHIEPVIDPAVGFVSWDSVINTMFCEIENLQVVCRACHDDKTALERDVATERKRLEKLT